MDGFTIPDAPYNPIALFIGLLYALVAAKGIPNPGECLFWVPKGFNRRGRFRFQYETQMFVKRDDIVLNLRDGRLVDFLPYRCIRPKQCPRVTSNLDL